MANRKINNESKQVKQPLAVSSHFRLDGKSKPAFGLCFLYRRDGKETNGQEQNTISVWRNWKKTPNWSNAHCAEQKLQRAIHFILFYPLFKNSFMKKLWIRIAAPCIKHILCWKPSRNFIKWCETPQRSRSIKRTYTSKNLLQPKCVKAWEQLRVKVLKRVFSELRSAIFIIMLALHCLHCRWSIYLYKKSDVNTTENCSYCIQYKHKKIQISISLRLTANIFPFWVKP